VRVKNLLLAQGYAVASLNYRLSGEARFPAQIFDVKAAVRYLRARAGSLGLDPDRFAAVGESAGGHLAELLGFSAGVADLEGSLGNPGVSSAVQAVVAYYGISDLRNRADQRQQPGCPTIPPGTWTSDDALLGMGPSNPARAAAAERASPIHYVDATDPPVLLLHGTKDCVVPPSQAQSLHDALRALGVTGDLNLVEGAKHSDRVFYKTTALQQQVLQFLDQRLGVAPLA
jgi:acetyl esterase/lipase